MPRSASISARISGDPKPLKQALDTSVQDTQSWVNKMVGLNQSVQRSYSSLAFSGPAMRGKSPIEQMADQDARAWARRMSDTTRNSRAFGHAMKANAGDAMLQAAYAADDLQYGLRGVMNNIPGLIMSFGGRAGLAGVILGVVIAAATLHKKLWDIWTMKGKIKELSDWLGKMNERLKEAADARAKEALEGTAQGAAALAAALEKANNALAEQNEKLSRTAANTKELAAAQAALAEAKISGTPKEQAAAEQRVEIELAKTQHAATMAQLKGEMEAHAARAQALDKYAAAQEAVAAQAQRRAASIDSQADPFIRSTEESKAAAAAVDATKARAEADKAHNESLREQKRIAEDIAQAEKVHALELEGLWTRTNKRISETEQAAAEAAAADKQRMLEATAEADEKRRSDAQAAQDRQRRELEAQRDEIQRRIEAEENGGSVRGGGGGTGRDRSRRIDARARPARRGFSVDDVIARQQSSLRGDLDAYIGPVGGRRQAAYTDRQAHQLSVNKAGEGSDPALATLRAIEKKLAAIESNTEGLGKGKSEPLRRN